MSAVDPRHASLHDALQGARIFWINSDHATERRSAMQAQLADISATRVRAFHPDVLVNATQFEWVSRMARRNFEERWSQALRGEVVRMYSKRELACMLSHLHAVHTALAAFEDEQRGIYGGVALIVEDDITFEFCQHWPLSLQELLARAPTGWQILQLQTHALEELHNMCRQREPFLRWGYANFAAVAYLINVAGMRRLLHRTGWPDLNKAIQFFTQPGKIATADELLYVSLSPHAYTFTRPLFGLSLAPTTIQFSGHQDDIEPPVLRFARAFYNGSVRCLPLRGLQMHGTERTRTRYRHDQLRAPREAGPREHRAPAAR